MLAIAIIVACLGTADGDPAEEAVRYLERCRDGEFELAAGAFDAKLASVLPAPKLKATWDSVVAAAGPLKGFGPPRVSKPAGRAVVLVRCGFERTPLDALVSFNADGKIDGFFLRPEEAPQAAPEPAPYVAPSKFAVREVVVGARDWPLGGTLAMPKGAGPFPLVVLIHGSGPHDRDETIGGNAPFRDLGLGLASRGVATLRYDKRTQAHPGRMAGVAPTLDDEVIDDALATLKLARTFPGVDPRRIFVIGHSLGAVVAPEVARRDAHLAGLIWMAGNVRPIDEVLLDQARHLSSPEANPTDQVLATCKAIEAGVAAFRADPDKAGGQLLGTPYSYWKVLAHIRPDRELADLRSLPVLALQGGRDYQVTHVDFGLLRQALAGRPDVIFHFYPELNHLFIPGTGPPGPADYNQPGHVDIRVIDQIASWIEASR